MGPRMRVGLARRGSVGGHLLAVRSPFRCRSGRLLLSRRRLPARAHLAPGAARPERRDPDRRPVLRPVRAVPGDRVDATRRLDRPGDRRPYGIRHQRVPRRRRGRDVLVAARARRREARLGQAMAVRAVRLLDADALGDDAGRRLAHGPADRDDADVRLSDRAVRAPTRLADRAACGSCLPHPRPIGVRDPGLCRLDRVAIRRRQRSLRPPVAIPDGSHVYASSCRGDAGWSSASRSRLRSSSSSHTTRSGSARRWSPDTRSPRCRTGSSVSARSACSRSATSR